jgi:hypothetical protein
VHDTPFEDDSEAALINVMTLDYDLPDIYALMPMEYDPTTLPLDEPYPQTDQ